MIRIVEVGPRDGLQNFSTIVETSRKIEFIDALSETGLREIEVSSFVSPKLVPQLADAAEVFSGIRRKPGVLYSALVPNERGLEGAIKAGANKIAVFTAASETFNSKNIGTSIAGSIERFIPVMEAAPMPVRGYISTAFYCPFEGKISPQSVVEVVKRLIDIGISEISIGDTIGKATPDEVKQLLEQTLRIWPSEMTTLHFHDTFGAAISNVRAAYDIGIRAFDSSSGGIGGCPFAPGAPGNIGTEAIVMEFGKETGIDIDLLRDASKIISANGH